MPGTPPLATGLAVLAALLLAAAACGYPRAAKAQQTTEAPAVQAPVASPNEVARESAAQQANPQVSGVVRGSIVDQTGTLLGGVHVQLTRDGQSAVQEVLSGDDGQFEIVNVPAGTFHLNFTATGFATQNYTGTLQAGEVLAVPEVTMELATERTEVRVEESTVEIAQQQIEEQEKQRVLGVIPNFYVTYEANAVPLNTRQKFELAWKSTLDPVTFAVTGAVAGVQQATDQFSGYGQGAQGYAKRYGASYADIITGTYIGGAILPSILKQDPRYFYKGTGTTRSRFWYAMANTFICKGDNGHWQFNYSEILGSLASGGISNLYYPDKDRGAALTFENFGVGLAATAGVNLLQEFVLRRLTPHAQKVDPGNP